MKPLFPILLAFLSLLTRAHADNALNGNLLLEAKGQVELYHNGKKLPMSNEADNKQHFRAILPARPFKVGDVIVLRTLSPYSYRSAAIAITPVRQSGQIAVKRNDWRYLGTDKSANKINIGDIQSNKDIPALGIPDGHGTFERGMLGMVPAAQGGSDWVASPTLLNQWYCMGFVITAKMLKTPVAVP
jgi:hypothetical protein